jgi:hypothetical protein
MKKLLLAIWLSWLAISMIGCATMGSWTFKSQNGEYNISIPKAVPNFTEWPGRLQPLYLSEDGNFALALMIGANPANEEEMIGVLWARDVGSDGIPSVHMIGIWYKKNAKAPMLYFIDKSYFRGGPATGKLELDPDPLSTEELVKIRLGNHKVQWEI